MIDAEQIADAIELRRESQADGRIPRAEEGDRRRQRPGEMLERERVGVTRRFEGRALVCARGRVTGGPASDPAR